jgi:two-component system, NtrC family, nitrogen regulation sensor histidine kinase NtrY
VTLAQRFMLAIGLVTLAATLALGVGVREAWRRAEARRFQGQFGDAVARLKAELDREIRELPARVQPLCEHDPVVDSVLVDLRAGQLDASRRLAIRLRVPETMKALGLDELTLLTGDGEILGAGHDAGLAGTRSEGLARRIRVPSPAAKTRRAPPLAIEAHCERRLGPARVGLVAARHLESILESVGRAQGLKLGLGEVPDDDATLAHTVELAELGGAVVVAQQSRMPLRRALAELDTTVLWLGTTTLAAALLVAWLLARGLARPIVRLSEQARHVVRGDPTPVQGQGGRELTELADSFNQALSDLAQLRKRLAATERIAARREIARRVAHEIKNPLMPIRTAIETLRRLRARQDPAFDAYFDEASRTVLGEVTRITTIVKEFTEFARLPPPTPAPLDLAAVVRDVITLHAGDDGAIAFSSPDLPPVHADRDQIVQLVTNLLQNALDAIRDQPGGRVHVGLEAPRAGEVVLAVRDNGPGVAPELQGRLFEPYATTKAHGTGLGLAMVQRIAVEHGGDVVYRSVPEGGAEFRVTLPLSGPTLLPEPPPSR